MYSTLARIRVFAKLLIAAGLCAGVPLVALAVKKVGVVSMTFAVGALLVLVGYAGLRVLMLSRDLAETQAAPASGPARV